MPKKDMDPAKEVYYKTPYGLYQQMSNAFDFEIVATYFFDEKEIHHNCTVQILRNSLTGDSTIDWWPEVSPPHNTENWTDEGHW